MMYIIFFKNKIIINVIMNINIFYIFIWLNLEMVFKFKCSVFNYFWIILYGLYMIKFLVWII